MGSESRASRGGRCMARFATVTLGVAGSNIDFGGTEIKVIQAKDLPMGSRPQPVFTCDGMFVPME
jgi:hypothetical protein